jgi:uncharacterized membrane protein (DUF485 family)
VNPVVEQITPEAHAEYQRINSTGEFRQIKRSYLGFVIPMTIAFMAWYLLYVFASNWAHDFMSKQVIGNVNVALVFGILQFASTFVIAWAYASFTKRRLDPVADDLREQFEREVER